MAAPNETFKIHVSQIPYYITEDEFCNYFRRYDEGLQCTLQIDEHGQNKGFGFLICCSAEKVDEIQRGRPHFFNGKLVICKRAVPQELRHIPDIFSSSKRIFIKGLSMLTGKRELRNKFQLFAPVVNCDIIKDQTGVSKGFAFIEYADYDVVDKLVYEQRHIRLDGRNLQIEKAVPREVMQRRKKEADLRRIFDYARNHHVSVGDALLVIRRRAQEARNRQMVQRIGMQHMFGALQHHHRGH